MSIIIRQRERMIFKAASPPFLITMIIGMIIILLSIPIFALPISDFICSFQIWFPNIGISLTLASLLVKAWRIDKMFNMNQLMDLTNPKTFSNSTLAKMIAIFVLIDICLLIIWTASDRVKPTITPHPVLPGILHKTCDSVFFYSMASILLIYYVCLLGWGVYLAIRTRKADPRFNESQSIAIAIYQFIILFVLLIPLFVLVKNPLFLYNVSSAFLVISSLIILASLFVKKFYLVLAGKENENIKISDPISSPTPSEELTSY